MRSFATYSPASSSRVDVRNLRRRSLRRPLVLWAFTGFASLELSGHGLVALILGFVLTTGVAAGLMALTFHSNRSHTNEAVHHSADR